MLNAIFFVILHITILLTIMFIFNTTFSIHESATDRCLKYIQTQYIPNLLDDGFSNPLFLKIHSESTDGYHNYAIQFIAPSLQFINNWKLKMETEYINEIRSLFGEKALTFSTIMESI